MNQYYRNACRAVEQIRNGEWVPKYNCLRKKHLTAHRGDLELWLGNGPFFCAITQYGQPEYLGFFWRHYVYWAAARKLKRDADRAVKRARPPTPVLP